MFYSRFFFLSISLSLCIFTPYYRYTIDHFPFVICVAPTDMNIAIIHHMYTMNEWMDESTNLWEWKWYIQQLRREGNENCVYVHHYSYHLNILNWSNFDMYFAIPGNLLTMWNFRDTMRTKQIIYWVKEREKTKQKISGKNSYTHL